jgi:cyclase
MLRISLSSLALLTVLAVLAAPAVAQNNFDGVEIQVVPVADGIHMLLGAGGNIGVSSGEDGVFLVDDQYAPLTEKIRAAVATIDKGPVRFVLNTHWHGDHTGGNENLGEAGTLIVAHDNVRERMSVDQFNETFGFETKASPKVALPVITFNDRVTFHLNGDHIHAYHVPPAHTDGDAIVRFDNANVVHMGDLFFNGMFPFIDLSSGGSLNGMISGVDEALETMNSATKVIPGHGPLSDKAGLASYSAMLKKARMAVGALVDQGKTEAEILEANPLADLDAEWGQGFIKTDVFTKIVAASLRQERHHH